MTGHRFTWVDAFTDTMFAGNPCMVVFDADDVDDATRLAVTRETRLSECAFLQDSDVADFGVRHWTAGGPIPMAGHPTIATIVALLDAGLLPVEGGRATCSLEVGAGVLPIEVDATGAGPPRVSMRQLRPSFGRTWDAGAIAPLVGLTPDDLAAPPQTVSTGTPFLVTLVRDHEALRRAALDVDALRAFHDDHDTDFLEPFLTAMGGATDGDVFSRLLLTPPEPPEDPFTGSATGCMAAWLWAHGHIAEPRLVAEQGHDMGRPGRAWVEVLGPPDDIAGVTVAGQGVVVLRGDLALPAATSGTPTTPPAAPAIAAAETGVTAFIGETEKHVGADPVVVTSVGDFHRRFGDGPGELPQSVRAFFANGGRRAVVASCPPTPAGHRDARARIGADRVDLVVLPPPAPGGDVPRSIVDETIAWAGKHGAVAILDADSTWRDADAVVAAARPDSPDAVLYAPRVTVPGATRAVAPSGAIAGMYARTDRTRGVWKAPAGLEASLRGVDGVTLPFDRDELEVLNPAGVNPLRLVAGRGVVAWGARTTSSDPEWRYVSVRRTALFVTRSLRAGLEWVVFEPNGEPLWEAVAEATADFLHGLFRRGAWAGARPEEAWFVRCDRTTMTQADLDAGILRLSVGFAPLKPAEFVIVRLQFRTATP